VFCIPVSPPLNNCFHGVVFFAILTAAKLVALRSVPDPYNHILHIGFPHDVANFSTLEFLLPFVDFRAEMATDLDV